MAGSESPIIGSEDLEKGLRAGHVRQVAVILVVAVGLLAVVNPGALVAWTQRLPSSAQAAWAVERAVQWRELMLRLGPAAHFERWRKDLHGS